MVYIRHDALPKLKEYKYSAVDKSLVSKYVMKPFYTNVAIHFFPMWMAPNLITLTGFGFVVINLLTMLYYNSTLDQEMPRWVYASCSIGLFLYQTFDAVDGTQARRTGQSGPLGELFDHGVDAVNTSLEVLIFAGVMMLGQGWKTVLILFSALLTFYVQTWDEYYTKTLTLGVVSGPVEGILTLVIVFAFTAFKGPKFWQRSTLECFGVKPGNWAVNGGVGERIYEMAWTDWYMVYGGIVLVFATYGSIQNVLTSLRARNLPTLPALSGLLPFFTTWLHIPLYLYLHPTVLRTHLIPFTFYCGLTNAYAVGRIIIAHLTKSSFPQHNVLNFPLGLAIIDTLGRNMGVWSGVIGEEYEVAYMFGCLGLVIGIWGGFVVEVITAITDYLDIWCLTIKHPVPVHPERESGKEFKEKKLM